MPVFGAGQTNLPQLGDGQEMSVAAERKLGQRIAREIYRDPDYLDDPLVGDYVQRIWQPLLQAARARGEITPELSERFAWEVMLARDRSVNAFALPGGYLGLHLGLVAIVSNRDELASVLAHELSHVTQRHIARMTTQQSQQAPWVLGAMILGALAARKNADVANAVITGSQAVSVQNQLNFSRDMEREADRVGYQVLQDAQFNVQGFVSMFDKLALANRINDNGSFPYLRTHPLTSERIGDMQARMQLGGPTSAAKPASPGASGNGVLTAEHAMISTRARLLADSSVDSLRNELAQARRVAAVTKVPDASAKAIGQLYGGALAAFKLRDLTTASSLAESAGRTLEVYKTTAAEPTTQAKAAIDFMAAELSMAQGNHARAQAILRPYVHMDPNNTGAKGPPSRSALLLWAQTVTTQPPSSDELARLVGDLQTWLATRPLDATAWDALAAAYTAQNQSLRAIRAQAEARVALLDYAAALDRLKAGQELARRSSSTDHIELSIIDSRTRAVQVLVRELQTEKPAN
jgi:predicted Zn-dependent protease